jgi:cytochrome d ubiquinol oxidase subunit I
MDLLDLSRFQFAFTAINHFIYVPLTLGLSVFIAIVKTIAYKTKDPKYDKLATFLMKLFAVNFAAGVATGLTMEFEFGTNWFTYSKFVGDIFGAPLAIEGLMAFFLESTFIGIFLFGKGRISEGMHTFSAWMVALGSNLSALWILIANSWMQTPAGYKIVQTPQGIRAQLTNFWEAVINHTTVIRLLHTVTAGQITAGFFVMGVMAYFLLRNKNIDMAKAGLKVALIFTTIVSVSEVIIGDTAGHLVAEYQPLKLAMMEGKWKTEQPASLDVFGYVDQSAQKTYSPIKIPYLLSFLAYHNFDAKVYGIKDLVTMYDQKAQNYANEAKTLEAQYASNPNPALKEKIVADKAYAKAYNISLKDLPPINLVFMPFHIMVGLGFFFAFVTLWGLYLYKKGTLYTNKAFLKTVLYSIPLPFIASELGWMTAEIGRQPWIVTGVLKTADAVSFNATSNVMFSVITFVTIYILLFYVYVTTMIKKVKEYEDTEAPSAAPAMGPMNTALQSSKTDLNNDNRIS